MNMKELIKKLIEERIITEKEVSKVSVTISKMANGNYYISIRKSGDLLGAGEFNGNLVNLDLVKIYQKSQENWQNNNFSRIIF